MIKQLIPVVIFFILFIFDSSFLNYKETGRTPDELKDKPPFADVSSHWVDSVFNSLSPDERIAQLFMIQAYSNRSAEHIAEVTETIKKYNVGGVILFHGGPGRQVHLVNHLQKTAKTPLLMAMDAEWGLSMRLDSTMRFPRQLKLGSIENNQLIYEMGAEIGRQLRRVGIHVNFAPVIDVNSNPNNPVIGSRSFGEDPRNVAKKGFAYTKGMQDHKVIAVGKHFPGHGDTDSDSHHTLPVIDHERAHLDSFELYPFKQLIDGGIGGIMIAHLNVPALDSTHNLPSSLSKDIVTGVLKEEMGFKGLVFTDALGMKAVRNFFEPGVADMKALLAGNDVLLMSKDIPRAIDEIKKAIEQGQISRDEINRRCKKVLAAKKWVGLDHFEPISTEHLYEDLHTPEAKRIKQQLIKASVGLINNPDDLIPFNGLDSMKFASFSIGTKDVTTFQETLDLYTSFEHFALEEDVYPSVYEALLTPLSQYSAVVVGIHTKPYFHKNAQVVNPTTVDFICRLAEKTKVVVMLFGNPLYVNRFEEMSNVSAVGITYTNDEISQQYAAQLLFGGIGSQSKLSLSTRHFALNQSAPVNKIRLEYSTPEDGGISEQTLAQIDSIINDAMEQKVFPGCQILAAKDGVVFYRKNFGFHTYSKKKAVTDADIYDLASITKVTATLPALMKLYEADKFNLDDRLATYIPKLDSSNKKNAINLDILTHQARFSPWLPFYLHTLTKDTLNRYHLNKKIYSNTLSEKYNRQVADNIYIIPSIRDSIFASIAKSKLRRRKRYRYSDLGFYLYQQVIEDSTKMTLDQYAGTTFYKPMGAYTLQYNPLKHYDRENIVPTEYDNFFRKQLVWGYVHDQGAAMLGGVAGHAGLFSNANDLAKMMQMYVQMGEYGGIRYFEKETVELFTSNPFSLRWRHYNHRGIGFDKPLVNWLGKPYDTYLSEKSFGHTGFTGTMVWADPEKQIIFVFLSNRIHPDSENNLIIELEIREKIRKLLFNALL